MMNLDTDILIQQALRKKLEEDAKSKAFRESDENPRKDWTLGDHAVNAMGQFNYGAVAPFLPRAAEEALADQNIMVDPRIEPTPSDQGFRDMGTGATAAVAFPLALTRYAGSRALGAMADTPLGQRIASSILTAIEGAPKTYLASELMGSYLSGYASKKAQDEGLNSNQQMLAALTIGALGSGSVDMLSDRSRRIANFLTERYLPFTDRGAMQSARKLVQQAAGGNAEEYAKLLNDPEVSDYMLDLPPAFWTENKHLMGQMAHTIKENPALEQQVILSINAAREASQQALREIGSEPVTYPKWVKNFMQHIAPRGKKIESGPVDNMLDQAYNGFTPLYDSIHGHPIAIKNTLFNDLSKIVKNESAKQRNKNKALDEIEGAFKGYKVPLPKKSKPLVDSRGLIKLNAFSQSENIVDSKQLLDLRKAIRDARREANKAGNQELNNLYNAANARITKILEENLPEKQALRLAETDAQYRLYKIAEDAVYRKGDTPLTGEQLSEAIRQSPLGSHGMYARKKDKPLNKLRVIAMQNMDLNQLVENPFRASEIVANQPDIAKAQLRSGFIETLMRRSRNQEASPEGEALDATPFVSGKKFRVELAQNKDVLKAMGITEAEQRHLNKITKDIIKIQRTPTEFEKLVKETPPNEMQLLVIAAGLKGAANITSALDLGYGGLALAAYMSEGARRTLNTLYKNKPEKILADTVTDRELYQSLLVGPTSSTAQKKKAANYLQAWAYQQMYNEAVKEDEDKRKARERQERIEEYPNYEQFFNVNEMPRQ